MSIPKCPKGASVKALESLIDLINKLLEVLMEKIKAAIPHVIIDGLKSIKHFPYVLKHKIAVLTPKVRVFFLKIIGYTQHYLTIIQGSITAFFIYLRSEEFKHDKKKALITNPINYIKKNPIKILTTSFVTTVFITALTVITLNTSKIVMGTKTHDRQPASKEKAIVIDNSILEMKDHKFEMKIAGGEGGGHGGGKAAHEEEEIVKADVKIKAINEDKKELLEEMEEMIDDYLEAMEITVPTIPLSLEEKTKLEVKILAVLNEGFKTHTNETPIVAIELVFHEHARPSYYRQAERIFALKNADLQVFLEETKRNHQVYIDFSIVASNRNIVLFLTDNEMMIRDRLSTNVEPILPHLPIEDEGRRIIKDKVRDEINEILKKEHIEGRILDVYVDFSISS